MLRKLAFPSILLAVASVVTPSAAVWQRPTELLQLEGDVSPIHDPAIIHQGNTYYVFASNRFAQKLLPIFCSQDLRHWQFCGHVFDAVPDWALNEIPGTRGIWAPDISYVRRQY